MSKLLAATAATAAAALTLALSSCSSDSGSDAPSTAPGDVSGDISYAFWDPNQQPAMEQIIDAFEEEYPDVSVTPTVTPFSQYWTTLQTQASSDTLPDVFWMNMPYFQLYASNGQLAPIDDLIDSGDIDPSKYPENLTDFYADDEHQYAVPKDVDTNAMWLNKALFAQAGVPLPDPDWTYDDYRATAKAIQDALGSQGVYGTAFYIFGQPTYYSSVYAFGGSPINAEGTESTWTDPGSEQGLQVWADIEADGSAPTVQQLSETLADQWFTNGKAAMFPSIGGASVALLSEAANVADYVAVPLPQGDTKATVGHALANVVSAESGNLAAAQAFQAFLASEEAQEIQASSGVTVSAYEGTADAFVQSHPDMGLQTFVDAIDYAFPYPASLNTDAWAADEPAVVAQAVSGAISVQEAAEQLADAMNDALAKE
jgi:multiple sugar transport system substrate-binding protein